VTDSQRLFRVELNRSGRIWQCTEIDPGTYPESTPRTRFVTASDPDKAREKAKAWYEDYRAKRLVESQRRGTRAFRERLKQRGICMRCQKVPAKPGKTICQTCADKETERSRRRRAKNREGVTTSVPATDPRMVLAKHRKNALKSKIATGGYVARQFALDKIRDVGPQLFIEWLEIEIANYIEKQEVE
jgi:hypothetical protein